MIILLQSSYYQDLMLLKVINKIKCHLTRPILYKSKFLATHGVPKFDSSKDYYQILELPKEASDLQIKQSYQKLAKSSNPAINPGKQLKFKEFTEAYSVLSHPGIKKQYNQARLSKFTNYKVPQTSPFSKIKQYVEKNLSPQQREQFQKQKRQRKKWNRLKLGAFLGLFVNFVPQLYYYQQDVNAHKPEPAENIKKDQLTISQSLGTDQQAKQ